MILNAPRIFIDAIASGIPQFFNLNRFAAIPWFSASPGEGVNGLMAYGEGRTFIKSERSFRTERAVGEDE